MKKYHIGFIIVFLIILGILFFITFDYPKRARNFPLIVMALSMLILIRELAKEIILHRRSISAIHADNATEPEQVPRETVVKFLLVAGWIAGLGVLIWLFGFLIAFPLFILVYIKLKGEKWLWAVIVSLSFWVVVYVGFGLLLKLPLYEGLFFQ
jgi:hypothetical protein